VEASPSSQIVSISGIQSRGFLALVVMRPIDVMDLDISRPGRSNLRGLLSDFCTLGRLASTGRLSAAEKIPNPSDHETCDDS
jgi:hypothetical protein